jgi:hypothetical protein
MDYQMIYASDIVYYLSTEDAVNLYAQACFHVFVAMSSRNEAPYVDTA